MVISVHVAEENALQVPQDLPYARNTVGIVSEGTRELTPCVLAAVQQYVAMVWDLYEGTRHW